MDPREELLDLTRMVRAYVEWHVECGAHGTPRNAKVPRTAAAPALDVEPMSDPPTVPDPAPPTLPASLEPAPPTLPFGSTPPPATIPTFSETPPTTQVLPKVAAVAPAPVATLTPEQRVRELRVIADTVKECMRCELGKSRRNTVFARGNPAAEICFVGEGPGADEDAQGLPFVGRAGQLLDRMIVAMGLDTERDVYICNIVKCRPPGNRRPEPDEITACVPYLHAQIALVKPKCIVALGNTAVAALLGTRVGITRMRGAWKLYKGEIPVMPTYHPSHLLREEPTQALHKKQVWEDLQGVMKQMGLSPPPRF